MTQKAPNLKIVKESSNKNSSKVSALSPREIVSELDRYVIGIGSGGNYALAAAKVLMETENSAEEIAKKAIKVASEICVFTNNNINIQKI